MHYVDGNPVRGNFKEGVPQFKRSGWQKAGDYAAEDADITLRLHRLLKPRLVEDRMTTLYETVERPLIPVVAAMEREGVLVDPTALRDLSKDFGRRMGDLETEIHELAGEEFNIGSPKQLGEILFGKMSLPGGNKPLRLRRAGACVVPLRV